MGNSKEKALNFVAFEFGTCIVSDCCFWWVRGVKIQWPVLNFSHCSAEFCCPATREQRVAQIWKSHMPSCTSVDIRWYIGSVRFHSPAVVHYYILTVPALTCVCEATPLVLWSNVLQGGSWVRYPACSLWNSLLQLKSSLFANNTGWEKLRMKKT